MVRKKDKLARDTLSVNRQSLKIGKWVLIVSAAALVVYVLVSVVERVWPTPIVVQKELEVVPIMLDANNIPIIPEDFDLIDSIVTDSLEKGGYVTGSDLLRIGNVYYAKSEYDKAMANYMIALQQAERMADSATMAAAMGNSGIVYQIRGDLESALKNYQEALKIDREIGDRQGEAIALGNIGLSYRAQGDLESALKSLNEALDIYREIGDRQGEAIALGSIGTVYYDQGDLDSALKNYEDALKIDREIVYRRGEAIQLGNIGIVLERKGEPDEALKHLQEALAILNRHGLAHGRDVFEQAIARIKKQEDSTP